ncbi:MAG TPA: inositol oxygenase family protein [Bryobacteraceae bacterium]|nr:inositol oxygenase family protein [Bryobacteraceae bacterium]
MSSIHTPAAEPMQTLDQWDDDVRARYDPNRKKEEFRQYGDGVSPVVREFYRQNHANQTYDFVQQKRRQWLGLNHAEAGIWEMMEQLNTLVDDSDPDTDLSQIEHNLQAAEAIRAAGYPRWFQLTGFIHDLGKIMWVWGEPQWAVVGDTFPVGCQFSDRIVFHEFFEENPDSKRPEYQTPCGIYEERGGLEKVNLSWGHDEYLYHITRDYLPEEAQYMIRYHSFYPGHREGAYTQLMNKRDEEMFEWVRKFNPFDLYSKSDSKPDPEKLGPYYKELIAEYFPEKIRW